MANDFGNISRALLGQGLGMGWGDEAEAWLRSKMGDEDYESALKDVRGEYGKFAKERPILAPGLEFAGGALPAIGALAAAPVSGGASLSALPALLRPAVAGAASGAISGAGAAENGRLSGAIEGGLLGGTLGGAVPLVGRAGGEIMDWLRGAVMKNEDVINRETAARLAKAAADKGISPQDLLMTFSKEEAAGRPGTLATQLPKLAETVAQRGGAGAETMERKIPAMLTGEGKYGSQRERIFDEFKKLSNKNFFEREQELVGNLRRNARDAYADAYALGDVNDDTINEILRHPKFAQFFKKAEDIADTEALTAKARGEDPEPYKLKKMYETILEDGKEPVERVTTIPGVKELDYIKRGMDAVIDEAYSSGRGAEGTALKNLRKEYIDAVDRATGGSDSPYRAARQQFAGDMEVLDAVRAGFKDFPKMSKQEVKDVYTGMSKAEKDAFRTGVVQNAYNMVMTPATDQNFAKKFMTPDMQDKLKVLFPTEAKFNLFKSAMEREKELFSTVGKIMKGSPTASRNEMIKAFETQPEILQAMQEAVTGDTGGLMRRASDLAGRVTLTDRVADKVAKLLTSDDPHEVAAAVDMITNYDRLSTAAAKKLSQREVTTATGLGVAAQRPPEAPAERDLFKDLEGEQKAPDIITRDLFKDLEDEQK